MKAKFYVNTAPSNKVDKTEFITKVGTEDEGKELVLYMQSSVSNPVFKIHADLIDSSVNYLKADATLGNRYYFIDDIVIDKGFKLVYCTVDPLMSFKDDIYGTVQMVNRCETKRDNMLVDSSIPMSVDSQFYTRSFGETLLTNHFTYILGVI